MFHVKRTLKTYRLIEGGLSALALGLFVWAFELHQPNSIAGWFIRDSYENVMFPQTNKRWDHIIITDKDIDVVVRTVIGEAAREPEAGQAAVVWVIINRARKNVKWYGGNQLANVSMHKSTRTLANGRKITTWQFEPWMSRAEYLWEIPTTSERYRNIEKMVLACLAGDIQDPTDGATHFLEPNIVMARTGGTLPTWAQGQGKRIGNHVFFKHG
jgi:hypothetical protein